MLENVFMSIFSDLAFPPHEKVPAIMFNKEMLTRPTDLITTQLQLGSFCKPVLVQMSMTYVSLENHFLSI